MEINTFAISNADMSASMIRATEHSKPCSFPPMYKSTGVKRAAAGEISCESLVGSR